MTTLTVEAVRKTFSTSAEQVRAVDGISFTARSPQLLCIHGASGSGKSTLLGLLAGLDVPDGGSVVIDGATLSSMSEAERADLRLTKIGVVFQHDNLIEEFTVLENVMFPLELRGFDPAAARSETEAWVDRVGLTGLGDRYPSQLSGGQQQRVGVARALVGDRAILLADEPTGALDSVNSEALFELLASLSRTGALIIVSSHDPLIRGYAHQMIEMRDGRLVGSN